MQYQKSDIKILIIDDNVIFTDSLKKLLFHVGGERVQVIDIVHSGEDGLVKFHEKVYDYIFVDIDLPGISGIELARIFDKDNSHKMIKIVAITFHNEFEYLEQMLKAGVSRYLVKDKISVEVLGNILKS